MTKSCLSRFLYEKGELELSFLNSLLAKQDLNECFYWINELYESKFCVVDILIKIYYEFYYLKNVDFHEYFIKNILKFSKNNDFSILLTIVKNLFYRSHCPTIFLLIQQNPTKISFRGKKPLWIDKISPSFVSFFRCAFKKDIYWNVVSDIDNNDFKFILKDISIYQSINKKNIFDDFENIKNFFVFIVNKNCLDIAKIILFSYLYVAIKKPIIEKKKLLIIKLTKQEINMIENWNDLWNVEKDKFGHLRIRKTLPLKRVYCINKLNMSFDFPRRHYSEFISDYFYNWEYMAKDCLLWKERMEKFQVTFKEKKVIFPDDDLLEEFYELYGYEPDEQSRETNDKAFPVINYQSSDLSCNFKDMSKMSWFEHLYKNDNQTIDNDNNQTIDNDSFSYINNLIKEINNTYYCF